MSRTQEARFLGSEPNEADFVDGPNVRFGHLNGDFENPGSAASVIVYAGACDDAVEMSADDDNAVRPAPGRFSNNVAGGEIV